MFAALYRLLRREWIAAAQPCRAFAPGAGTQMAAVAVLRIAGACDERVPRFVERIAPGLGVGACLRGSMAIVETAHE
jgi:hypothetical protein